VARISARQRNNVAELAQQRAWRENSPTAAAYNSLLTVHGVADEDANIRKSMATRKRSGVRW